MTHNGVRPTELKVLHGQSLTIDSILIKSYEIKKPVSKHGVTEFFDDLLPRFEYLLPPFEFFLPSFDVLLPLVDFLLPIIMGWLHVYPQPAMILGSTSKRRLRTQLLAAAGRVLSNLDNEYKRVNFSFR